MFDCSCWVFLLCLYIEDLFILCKEVFIVFCWFVKFYGNFLLLYCELFNWLVLFFRLRCLLSFVFVVCNDFKYGFLELFVFFVFVWNFFFMEGFRDRVVVLVIVVILFMVFVFVLNCWIVILVLFMWKWLRLFVLVSRWVFIFFLGNCMIYLLFGFCFIFGVFE